MCHLTNHHNSISFTTQFYEFKGGDGGRELLTCPYPLKVQACPPRDQRPALRPRVSGQEERG